MPIITKKLSDQAYGRFVIAEDINDDGAKQFLGFDSARDVFPYIEEQPARHFHETMIGTEHRKIYFDADRKIGDGEFPNMFDFMDDARAVLLITFSKLCGGILADTDICFTDSSTDVKFSMHIIIPSINTTVDNMRNIFKIVSTMMERINPIYKNILDPNVYKANQNLRLLHCNKMGKSDASIKKLVATSFNPIETLISYLGNSEYITFLPDIQKIFDARAVRSNSNVNAGDITKTPELFNAIVMGLSIHRATNFGDWQRVCLALGHECAGLNIAIKFAERADNFNEVATTRLYNSGQSYTGRPCTLGTLLHMLKIDNIIEYNKLIIHEKPAGVDCDIIKMIDGIAIDDVDIFEDIDSDCDGGSEDADEHADEIRLNGDQKIRRWLSAPDHYLAKPVNNPARKLDKNDTRCIYDDEYMRDYEPEHNTIIIKGNKGVGKTHALVRYIKQFDPDNTKRIAYLSFRRSFSNELLKRLEPNGFENYRDIDGPILNEHKRIIIQVESLPRISWTEKCDLIVLDEIESIRTQFMSPTCRRRELTIDKYSMLLRSSVQAIVMDADISDNTVTHIKNTRDGPVHYIENTRHEVQSDFKEYYTTNLNKFMGPLCAAIESGQRLVIPTNRSVSFMESLQSTIQKKYPHIKIQMYNSKTIRDVDTASELIDIEASWIKYDIIMYSPTISAGVSFDKVHFDSSFGIFVNNGKVNNMRQMTNRVRKFSTNKFYYCLQSFGGSTKPTNLVDYEKYICSNRFIDKPEFIKSLDNYNCTREYPYKDCAYYLWVYNEIEKIRDKNMFLYNFLREQYHSGVGEMAWLPDEVEPPKITKQELSLTKNELVKIETESIANAAPIDDVQAADIILRLDREEPITNNERYQLTRRKLLECYDMDEKTITPEFVAAYNIKGIKSAYHNRKLLATGIKNVMTNESIYFNEVCADTDNGPTVCDDLAKNYKGARMVIADELLTKAGFNGFYDTAEISKNTIYENFKNIESILIKKMPHICNVLGRDKRFWPDIKQWPERLYLQNMIKFINSIISDLFQLKIKQTGRRTGLYIISGIDKYNFG